MNKKESTTKMVIRQCGVYIFITAPFIYFAAFAGWEYEDHLQNILGLFLNLAAIIWGIVIYGLVTEPNQITMTTKEADRLTNKGCVLLRYVALVLITLIYTWLGWYFFVAAFLISHLGVFLLKEAIVDGIVTIKDDDEDK